MADKAEYVTQVDDQEATAATRETEQSEADTVGVPPESQSNDQTLAVVMMNLYCVANTGQCILYKILSSRGVDLLEYTLFRNLTIMAFVVVLLIVQHRDPVQAGFALKELEKKMLLGRAMLGYVITLLINMCLTMIPFSLIVIIFQTAPFWTSILSFYVNGEKIMFNEMVGMGLCFMAIILITTSETDEQNELLSGQTGHVDDELLHKSAKQTDLFIKVSGILLMLISAVMSASIAVLNRSLRGVPYAIVLFYHSFFGIIMTGILLFSAVAFTERPLYFLDFTPFDNFILFSATALDAISVMCQTIAFQRGNASFISLISFVNIIYAMAADIVIFNENVNAMQGTSAIFILVVCLFVGYSKVKVQPVKTLVKKVTQIIKE